MGSEDVSDRVRSLCSVIEADAHCLGWDQPPALLAVVDATDQRARDYFREARVGGSADSQACGLLAVQVIPAELLTPSLPASLVTLVDIAAGRIMPEHAGGMVTPEHVGKMAEMIGAIGDWLRALAVPGLVGLAVRFEGWGSVVSADPGNTGPVQGRHVDEEFRMVGAAIVGGGVVAVRRRRGERVSSRLDSVMGVVPAALSRLTDVIGGCMDPS